MDSSQIIEAAGNVVCSPIGLPYHNALLNHAYGSGFSSRSHVPFLASYKQKVGAHWLRHRSSERPSASPRCQAGDASGDSPPSDANLLAGLDRRELLLASSLGFAGLPFIDAREARGAPVQPPDFTVCTTPIDPGNGAATVDCCLPTSTTIVDFEFPTSLPTRVRLPAHSVTSDYIAKYNNAYKLLRELSDDDPRKYTLQANVHCAFCDGAYVENGTSVEYQVHNSWLFFPWHRWYLYFHERILAKLIDDDTFALSFWNWDSDAGSTLPALFIDNAYLYDTNRNSSHQPPTVVDLNFSGTESGLSTADQLATNKTIMYRQVVSNAKTPTLFFGEAYRQGTSPSPGAGTVENIPHGTVHTWTGNPDNPNDENMGALYSAARDPVFFAHHSNVDRLWEVWKSLGGRRTDITDTDWLDAKFLFYDENKNLVRVSVSQSLDISKLAYSYEAVSNDWLTATASSTSTSSTTASAALRSTKNGPGGAPSGAMAAAKEKFKEFKERKSKKLEGVVKALVKRPKKVKADDDEEEILLIEGVEVPTDQKVKFDVFVNLPEANEKTGVGISEYAGSFYNLPHLGKSEGKSKARKSNFKIGIGEVLRELGIEDAESFTVTIVPRVKAGTPISINDIKLEYE